MPAATRAVDHPRWARYLPLLVVAVLAGLVIVPYLLHQRTSSLRSEIDDWADPGRTNVTEIQYRLARQTAALRGFAVSGNRDLLDQFEENIVAERVALDSLEVRARNLGPEVYAYFVALRDSSTQWHARIAAEVDPEAELTVTPGEIPFQRGLYLATLNAGSRLDSAIREATRERRAAIGRIERLAFRLNILLVAIALLSALLVAWLSGRAQSLAAEAEARRAEAEAALLETALVEQARASLIRGVTHDVKNPLGAVDGYAELLELGVKGPLSPAQAETVAKLRNALRSALMMIEDLLDLSRAQGGGLPLRLERTDLREVVVEVVEENRVLLDTRRHALQLRLPEEECPVRTDPDRARQILGNLLGNAAKYTPIAGSITVSVSRTSADSDDPSEGAWVSVEVRDSGPGVPERWRERVFEEFTRVPGSAVAGHGLGLAISRRIARLLGGDIEVESEVGVGSAFTLWLPCAEPAEEPQLRG